MPKFVVPPPPPCFAIQHTKLVMAISCKHQGVDANSVGATVHSTHGLGYPFMQR